MKRTFGKSLVFFILIVLFTLCAAVGCTTLNVAPIDDQVEVTNPNSTVKMELNRSVLLQGGEVELTITAKMKNDDDSSRIWGSAEFWISSSFAEHISVTDWFASSSTTNVEMGNVGGAFESKYDIKLDTVTGNSNGFLHFYMASNNSSKKVSASVPLIIKIKLKYSEDAPEQSAGAKMAFTLNRADYNFIADYTYNGDGSTSTQTGVKYTADASATNKLNVEDTNCFVELREATDDNLLQSLWVSEEGIPTQEKHTPITVLELGSDGKDVAKQKISYTAEKASKDTFYIRPSQRQSGAKVKVFLGDRDNELTPIAYDTENPHIGIYKVNLDGDAYTPKGEIKIIIAVISEAQLDGTSTSAETELIYELTVTQTYCGLDNIKVTSNENEKLNIAEDKKGLNPDFPNEDHPTTYKVRVPVGQVVTSTQTFDGATKVNIKPTVLASYGINKTINITANNCTASSSNINTGANGNFDVTNIKENSSITLQVLNSQGATTTITIEFELISINTAIDGALKLTYGDGKELSATNVGGIFNFKLPKASEKEFDGSYIRVGDLSATLSDGATFVIKKDGTEIDKVGEGDNAKYQLQAGDYEMLVTSAAGNTQSYTIHVENESVAGAIVRFEFKTTDGDWILVYEINKNIVIPSDAEYNYDADTNTFTLNGSTDLENVYFRFALTDDSTLTGLTADSEVVGDGQFGTYKTYTYTYSGLKTGINKKDVKVNSNKAVGGNTYTLEIVNTEQDYQIIGIDIGEDSSQNPLVTFDQFVDNGKGELEHPTISVPFATNKINLVINAEGHSTQVFVNDKQLWRETTGNTADGKPQTIHTGEYQLIDGRETVIKITHKGTDGIVTDDTKTYVIKITRLKASSDATLKTLEIYLNAENADDVDKKLDLGAAIVGNNYFTIRLNKDTPVNKVFINAEANDKNATVSGSMGLINLENINTDTYKFNIVVTPENSVNGSGKMIYTIELQAPTSDLETINTLKEFQIIGNNNVNYLTGDNKFEEARNEYNVTVPYSISVFNLIAVTKGNAAKLSVKMNDTVAAVDNLFELSTERVNLLEVTVTPQNTLANPMVYTVRITRQKAGGSAQLNGLDLFSSKGASLFPTGLFSKDTYAYELNVSSSSDHTDTLYLAVNAPAGSIVEIICDNSIIPIGDNNRYKIGFIDYGTSKTYQIKVTRDADAKTYLLKINRELQTPSLDTLVITQNEETIGLPLYDKDGKDQVSYEKGVYEYSVKISYDVEKLVITTTAQPNVISGSNTYSIDDIDKYFSGTSGTKPYEFKIQTGSITQQYIIHITRLANPASNASIEDITISKIASFQFSGDVSSYGPYTVENAIDILQPKVECEDENATVQIFVNGELANNNIVNLVIGENNIKIVVTAADRIATKEVYIKVNRKHPSISAITVTDGGNATLDTGVTINDDINAYSFTVGKDVDKINLSLGLANGYTQTIKSGDPNNLKVGEFNKITIEVKDSNNQVVRTIEFNVFRENPADYTLWFIIAGVLGGIILILLILTIVAFTKGGNAKKRGNINDIGIGDYELD